ncbi:uncharacterized protein Z519_04362 [Cladophialophora bantiana CBS 173.52]|uniref:Uncharacterized protein n=1 Tax=Cladophialophora bantiana (strain ATCC 10958 / CBS 173.52 / CDC B-1940 / NIH 8579) TaxID=1442370 RepID=A0A0D2EWY2_CLAB1|nr:uncharacterized protein Z519_04362 [Cladophialophora bantiana CBS 173.52]KIW94386.1 hypothetical protein Z519_04362 [Cladophialophora bantiana CBS 173.52]
MSDPSVSERRIRPIQDAIASANWKQALQLCDKWFKKGERSDRFLALKAFVLVNQQDKAQHDRGRGEVFDLCKRTPPITEPEAIYQLQHALKSLSLHEESPKLWERALSANKDDKDLYMRWLNQAVADNNWRSAQKATMGLRNSFSKERDYDFWNILMCYLIHMQQDLPDKDRTLFGTLAYRMISKLAEAVPKNEEEASSSGKAISVPEEIALLVQVLNSTGHVQESVKLLQGPSLNMESRIGKQDPQLVLTLLLESLEVSEQWDEALNVCQNLLSKSEHQSDDRIWNLWATSRSKLSCNELGAKSKELLDSVCTIRPIVRAAYLAKLNLQRTRNDEAELDALLETCKEYFEAFSSKGFCFDDLKRPLRRLDQPRFDRFKQTVSDHEGNLAQLFNLMLSYSSLPPDASQSDLLAFARRTLQRYQTSLSESPPCPEAALLAVLAILRLGNNESSPSVAIFAAILLQIARSKFEDYYILTILLVQLQSHLGLLSLGMENFVKLSVKNLQWETAGHLILTRISSLHPAPTAELQQDFEPLLALETGLTVLENADSALVRGIREGLRFNSYSNIYNSVKMRSDIEGSMNKHIYAIEERKIRRWREEPYDHTILPLTDSSKALVDKRDFGYMPNYRDDDTQLLAKFRCGPLPKERWINAMALFDSVATYLKVELASQTSLAATAYDNLKQAQKRLSWSTAERDTPAEMTKIERTNLECHRILAQAIVMFKEGSISTAPASRQDKTKTLPDLLSDLKGWLSSTLTDHRDNPAGSSIAGIRVPTWEDLHRSFTQLETLQVIANLISFVSKKPQKQAKSSKAVSEPISKEMISEIQSVVVELEGEIHREARELKSAINEPGVLGKLVDLGMVRRGSGDDGSGTEVDRLLPGDEKWESLMESLCDEVMMETICGGIKDSWDEALDGVLGAKGKIRIGK